MISKLAEKGKLIAARIASFEDSGIVGQMADELLRLAELCRPKCATCGLKTHLDKRGAVHHCDECVSVQQERIAELEKLVEGLRGTISATANVLDTYLTPDEPEAVWDKAVRLGIKYDELEAQYAGALSIFDPRSSA